METKRINFTNSNGQKLSAKLELPIDQKPVKYALFAHCFTCNKNLKAVGNISRALTNSGFGVLRFDFTGLGESEGDFEDTNFSSNIQDLICAADYMKDELEAPELIIGHSLGGAAAIFAANELDDIQAVATVGSPSSPDHIKHLFKSSLEQIEESGKANLEIAGREFQIKKQFIDDISAKNMSGVLENLKKSILIMHSPQDNIVGVNNAAEIYQAAKHPKSFVSLDGADHLLTNSRDSEYVGEVISSWAVRYLDMPEKDEVKPKKTVLARIGSSGFTTDISTGKHYIRADEPKSVGGNDFGPNPYDLLMSSLGACTAMTMRMYADRKKWAVEEIRVHLSHKKEHCDDCKDSNVKKNYIDKIEKEIEIIGDLDIEQKNRLIEIADKCPVHRTLHSEVEISTELIK